MNVYKEKHLLLYLKESIACGPYIIYEYNGKPIPEAYSPVDVLLKRHQAGRNSRMGVDHNNISTQLIAKQCILQPELVPRRHLKYNWRAG